MKIRSLAWSCGPTVFRERFWGTVLRMKHSRQKWIGYLLFDAAFRPSFVARLWLSPRLGRIFFNKQTSNQLDAQLVIAICDRKKEHWVGKPSFLIGWLSNIRRLLTFAENAVKRYALCRKMKIVIRNLIYSVSGFLLL